MPRDAFVLIKERDLCHPKCARKVSGLSRNGPLARLGNIVADANVSQFSRALAGNMCCGNKFCCSQIKNVFAWSQKYFCFPDTNFASETYVSQFTQPSCASAYFQVHDVFLAGSVIIFLELPADAWDAAECMKRIVKARAKRAKLLFSFLIKQIR